MRGSRVAVPGTGIMGSAMARNLVSAGLRTTVWDRSPTATEPLSDAGALVTAFPAEARSRYSQAQCRMSRRSGCHDEVTRWPAGCPPHAAASVQIRNRSDPGPPRTASSPSRHKGQIADGFPEPETLTSHAPRTQSQVTAMISVPSAAPGSIAHSAGGHPGGTSGLHNHRIHNRKTLTTRSPLTESNRRPSPYHGQLHN